MSEINDMIKQCGDKRKKEILIELKGLNKQAYKFMLKPYLTFKQKYRQLQHTPIWSKAKELLIEYFTDPAKPIIICPLCNNNTRCNDFVLHHDQYTKFELFTPIKVMLIHKACHTRLHMNKRRRRK